MLLAQKEAGRPGSWGQTLTVEIERGLWWRGHRSRSGDDAGVRVSDRQRG